MRIYKSIRFKIQKKLFFLIFILFFIFLLLFFVNTQTKNKINNFSPNINKINIKKYIKKSFNKLTFKNKENLLLNFFSSKYKGNEIQLSDKLFNNFEIKNNKKIFNFLNKNFLFLTKPFLQKINLNFYFKRVFFTKNELINFKKFFKKSEFIKNFKEINFIEKILSFWILFLKKNLFNKNLTIEMKNFLLYFLYNKNFFKNKNKKDLWLKKIIEIFPILRKKKNIIILNVIKRIFFNLNILKNIFIINPFLVDFEKIKISLKETSYQKNFFIAKIKIKFKLYIKNKKKFIWKPINKTLINEFLINKNWKYKENKNQNFFLNNINNNLNYLKTEDNKDFFNLINSSIFSIFKIIFSIFGLNKNTILTEYNNFFMNLINYIFSDNKYSLVTYFNSLSNFNFNTNFNPFSYDFKNTFKGRKVNENGFIEVFDLISANFWVAQFSKISLLKIIPDISNIKDKINKGNFFYLIKHFNKENVILPILKNINNEIIFFDRLFFLIKKQINFLNYGIFKILKQNKKPTEEEYKKFKIFKANFIIKKINKEVKKINKKIFNYFSDNIFEKIKKSKIKIMIESKNKVNIFFKKIYKNLNLSIKNNKFKILSFNMNDFEKKFFSKYKNKEIFKKDFYKFLSNKFSKNLKKILKNPSVVKIKIVKNKINIFINFFLNKESFLKFIEILFEKKRILLFLNNIFNIIK